MLQEGQPANFQEEFISTIETKVLKWRSQNPPGVEVTVEPEHIETTSFAGNVDKITREVSIEEKLIEAVKSERCLYDVSHVNYRKKKLRDSIWRRIAMALHFENPYDAKKMWERLRNNFRHNLFRKGPPIKPTWYLKENMDFIAPFIINSANRNKKPKIKTIDRNDDDVYIIEDEEDRPKKRTKNKDKKIKDKVSHPKMSIAQRLDMIISNDDSNEINQKIKEIEQKFLQRETNDEILNKLREDPLFNFFVRMYESTKTFRTSAQIRIKRNIFSMVYKEEMNHRERNDADQQEDKEMEEIETLDNDCVKQIVTLDDSFIENEINDDMELDKIADEIFDLENNGFDIIKIEETVIDAR